MIPHLVYYQLVILVLLWLCLMLPYLWPSPPGEAPKTPTQPIRPKRKPSTEPKPFAGLTRKPHCALCEQEIGARAPAPPRRPDPMPPTHRRPRTVDTSMHFCPHTDCDYRGWLGLNNLRANGHPQALSQSCIAQFIAVCRSSGFTNSGSYFMLQVLCLSTLRVFPIVSRGNPFEGKCRKMLCVDLQVIG